MRSRCILIVLLVLSLVACSNSGDSGQQVSTGHPVPFSPEVPEWVAAVESAREEGSVICACPPVGALGEFLDAEWSAAFPGIALERTSAVGDWPARIATERSAGVYLWDVYFWASNPPSYALKNQGAFVPLIPELILPEVADEHVWGSWESVFMDIEKQYLMSFRGEISTVAYNARIISPEEFTDPEDLLNPAFRGQISIDDPRVAGAGDVFGAWFVRTYGADAWRRLLTEQEINFAGSRDDQAKGLVRGPHYIAVPSPGAANMQPYVDAGVDFDMREMGYDAESAFMTIAYSTIGILSKAPHPNAAKVFVNWLLSRDIQEKLKRFAHNSRRNDVSPAFPEKQPRPGVQYFMPQAEDAIEDREIAIRLAKEVRPN